MHAAEAKRRAILRVKVMLEKGRSRHDIATAIYEGSIFPDPDIGYLLSGGRISIPGVCHHGDAGSHVFKVADLFAELDSPQGGLFA